jgi:hypothetical protein
LDESPRPIRGRVFDRDDEFSDRDERSTRTSRASIATTATMSPSRYGTFQMSSLVLSRTLTAFGSTLPPDAFMT